MKNGHYHKDGLLYQDGQLYVASGYDGEDNPKFEKDNCPSRYEVMQFTGMRDADGKEIFEGDILRFKTTEKKTMRPISHVFWDNDRSKWMLKVTPELPDGDNVSGISNRRLAATTSDCWFKVVGNIYENPELIQENG